MKKIVIYLSLCIILGLSSCSESDEIEKKNYTKISSELTELLNTTEPYKYYYEWSNAVVIVTDESLTIQDRYWKTPDIQIVEKDRKAHMLIYFKAEDEFGYTKNNEQKKAVLSMSYYVNFAPANRVLVCSLSVNEGKDTYKFYYDPELNCIYEYNENIKEELVFAKNLQNTILYFCGSNYASFERRVEQVKDIGPLLFEKLGYQEVEWTEIPEPDRYEYALMDKSEKYETIFEDFVPDEIYPMYSMNPKKEIQSLFIVEKDGLYGVINDKGWLVVPFVATSLPMEFDTHIHYIADNYEKGGYGQYLPYSHYYTCSGEHGHAPEEYLLIDGQSNVQAVYYGDEGPGSWVELTDNELNGKLNAYELVIAHPSPEEGTWIEDFSYERTQKYGIFSDEGIVTEALYENCLQMTADLLAVKKNGKWGYVDASGNEVIPCIYNTILDNGYQEFVYPAADGYIVVKNDKGMFGVLNYSGEVLVPFNYEAASPYLDETVLLKKDNKWIQANPFTASYVSMDYSLSSGTVKDKSYKNPSIGLKLDYTANSTVSTRYATEDIHLKHGERFNDLTLENNGAKLFIDFIKIDGSQDMNDEELYKAIISEYTDLFSNLYIGFWHEKEIGDLIFRECSATIGTGTSIINNFYFRRHGEYIVLIRLDYDFEKTDLGSQWIESIQKCNNILDLGMGTLPEGELIYFGNPETNDTFKPIGFPTFVLVDQTNRYIEFGFEGGFEVDPENNPNFALYTGTLTEIDDQIYSSKGSYHYLDYQGNLDDFVKKNVDFYLVLKRDRLYVILQEMTLEELKAYESEDFYLLDLDL